MPRSNHEPNPALVQALNEKVSCEVRESEDWEKEGLCKEWETERQNGSEGEHTEWERELMELKTNI